MSRRRAPSGPTISLFPFLAVLLCTMGALLVLLVLFSRSAERADAAAEAEAARRQIEELELARDEFAWRLGQLEGVRSRTADELAKARMQLAGIEEHARALVDELEQLGQTAEALASPPPAEADDEPPVEDLERQLADAKRALEAARADAADRPPAYAVVPYEGAAGTHRRPLYIECCIDGVFLQPEGIRLGPADFEGPPGPGNPLASALRAAREHLANRPGESGEPSAQPYPLLLVRPSGVMAYYAARESLQSWGSDFGYQFVDEDWTLAYPPADPALADVERRAVEESRRRLEWLAQARPQKRTRPAVQYRASNTRGGVVSSEGPSVLGDQSRFDWTEEQAAAAGRGFRAGGDAESGRGDAVLGNGTGDPAVAAGGDGPAGGGSGSSQGDRYRGPSKFYGGSGSVGGSGEAGDQAGAGAAADGSRGGGDETSLLAGDGLDGGPAGSVAGGSATQGEPGGAGGDASAGAGDVAGNSGAAGGSNGKPGSAGSSGGGTAAAAAGSGGGSFGPALPGMAEGQAGGGAASQQDCADGTCSMAGRRGSNWASLATSDRPIPLTRPLRLECSATEFRLLGSGGRVTARVPIPSRTADAIDPLVREVHAAVGGWGMAGDRMYWKPELVLTATPDGVDRRDELEQLLADSGLDTRRADEGDAVRSLPPVHRTGGVFRSR
jgi:archaellum component FlaC